jgi:hypothetical protein
MPLKKKKPLLAWKRRDGWVQFYPHPHHPCYEEWVQKKEKEDNDSSKDNR